MIMAGRPLKFALYLDCQPGTTIQASVVTELCQQQLIPAKFHLVEKAMKKHRGCFRCVIVGVYFFSFEQQVQCSNVSDDDIHEVAVVQSNYMWNPITEEVNAAAYSFFYKGDVAEAAILKDKLIDMPTDAVREELKVIEERVELMTDIESEFVDENERTAALYHKLKPDLDANGFLSSNLETTLRFGFDKSCCFISGGADIVFFNPNGILVMDVSDNTFDDSAEEGELKGVSTSESKLKMQSSDINQVIGEGIMFASRYLLRMIADKKVDLKDTGIVKAYVVWMVYSSTIRFYSLKADFDTSTYSLVRKGTAGYTPNQPKRLGQYLTLLLKKLKA